MKRRVMVLFSILFLTLPLSTHITATPNAEPSALEVEMAEVRQREAADLQALAARIAASADRLEILGIERDMADRRVEAEIELLEIRGRHARDEGRDGRAEEIEKAVARLRAILKGRPPEGGDRP